MLKQSQSIRINVRQCLYVAILLYLSLLVSFRPSNLNDYGAYKEWFDQSKYLMDFIVDLYEKPAQIDPLFFLGNSLFKTIFNWRLFLATIFFISIFIKLLYSEKVLGRNYSVIFILFYFATSGLQFEFVQFRYGLAIGLVAFGLVRKSLLLVFAGVLTHLATVVVIPLLLLLKLYTKTSDAKSLRIVSIILTATFAIFYLSAIYPYVLFSKLIELGGDAFIYGKLMSQITGSTSAKSLITFVRVVMVGSICIFIKPKDETDKTLHITSRYFAFLMVLSVGVDNFDARVLPLLEFFGYSILFRRMSNIKKNQIVYQLSALTVVIVLLLMAINLFLKSSTMLLT